MSPIKEEEIIPEKFSPVKDEEMPKTLNKNAIKPQKSELEDSLEKSTFAKRLLKDINYSSNPDQIPPFRNLKIQPHGSEELIKVPEPKSESKIESREQETKPLTSAEHFIQFRMISTWGSISQGGLTEIQIFDEDGEKIELKATEFHLKNCGLSSIKTIYRLINGVVNTTEEDNMWLCHMPAPPITPELTITIKSKKMIGGFRIWNYNKSLIDSIKGVKELEIIHNRNIVWFGNINRGSGNEVEAYHTEILLNKDIVLPKIESPALDNRTPEPELEQKKDNLPMLRQPSSNKNNPLPERSTSVPVWLQDVNAKGKPAEASSFETKPVIGNSSRRSAERSSTHLSTNKLELEPNFPSYEKPQNEVSSAKNQGKLEAARNRTNEDSEARNRPTDKVKSHPRINSPFQDVFEDKPLLRKADEKYQKPQLVSEQKENLQGANKDDNSSINSVEYFNITNFGRLKPAKRESLQQVINLQQDVFEKIRDVQKRLDFKTSPIVDGSDILSQFDKDLLEHPKKKLTSLGSESSLPPITEKKELKQNKPSQGQQSKLYSIKVLILP